MNGLTIEVLENSENIEKELKNLNLYIKMK